MYINKGKYTTVERARFPEIFIAESTLKNNFEENHTFIRLRSLFRILKTWRKEMLFSKRRNTSGISVSYIYKAMCQVFPVAERVLLLDLPFRAKFKNI